jgi:two-component system phosphate regulon sensor histidine kinase PhoR
VYRTVSNYQLNKQRFINDVQQALDLSIEKYYADRARSHFSLMTITQGDTSLQRSIEPKKGRLDSLFVDQRVVITKDNSVKKSGSNGYQYSWSSKNEQVDMEKHLRQLPRDSIKGSLMVTSINISTDSADKFHFNFDNFEKLTQRILISTTEETMDLEKLKSIVRDELQRKSLTIGHELVYRSPQDPGIAKAEGSGNYPLSTFAKNTYLSGNESLKLHFENAPMLILKRGAWDLVISFAIVFSVIGALLYLYQVIKNQKELAMIKDDLIGNVTHEFKTPIATVTSALEGIANFNDANDKEKTKRYLDMSRDQLAKLNLMVEKLMETATIDSGKLEINKIETELTSLTTKLTENFRIQAKEKIIITEVPDKEIWAMADPFHWENVIANLLDNAIKYGGDEIKVSLKQDGKHTQFQVIDNGGHIDKNQQSRVFEKLYRIPKGNQHDVKGFGIGLYYTKAVVEQHGGTISLDVSPGRTAFTIVI